RRLIGTRCMTCCALQRKPLNRENDMDRERIEEIVMEIAAEIGNVPPEQIAMETHFVNDLQYDSLDRVEFTVKLEEELELSVPDEEAENLQTVGDVVKYVKEKLQALVREE